MLSLNISVGIKVCDRTKKLWVEESLTAIYQQTGNIPRVGYKLKTGDVVIGKGSDDTSIILFINNNKKSKK